MMNLIQLNYHHLAYERINFTVFDFFCQQPSQNLHRVDVDSPRVSSAQPKPKMESTELRKDKIKRTQRVAFTRSNSEACSAQEVVRVIDRILDPPKQRGKCVRHEIGCPI